MFGCFELVLLAEGFGGLLLLYQARRITGKDLCWFGFYWVLGVSVLGMSLGSLLRGHEGTWIAAMSVAGILILMFILIGWTVKRGLTQASPPNCPPIDRLKDLLAERLSPGEHARLAAHLELCPACQHRVEGLTTGQKSWPGMARKLSEPSPSPEPALRKVMAQLKEGHEEATGDEPVFCGDLPLGFLNPPDKPGQLGRLERYEVLEEIGRGGMGVVLKAFDPSLHRVVAIKVLAPQLATSGVARKRFLREAKAAAAVTHDHIVTIHAVDEANGLPYLVMQYVPGQSLQDRIDKDGPLELADILRIGMQTASGLAAAHAHGIIHRDIKPANILLEEGVQRVKITDFGLARAMDDASLTQSGFVAGSPLYMAPEQARGEALDHRADLFSLGSVLYTACTGRPPFRAANTLAVLRRVSEDAPRPIRETNPEVPDWLADVVAKLMAKEPAERFASAAEVVEVFGQHLAPLPHGAWVPPPRPPSRTGPEGDTAGLPTSLTLCPSCGASLHVPESMVGGVVHCAECGKPFQVEEGSAVLQVARPARWPFGARGRTPGRLPRRAWIAGGCAALLLLSILLLGIAFESHKAPPVSAPASPKPSSNERPALPPGYWISTLNGLPPGATLLGTIDLTANDPTGSLTLDDASIRALLPLFVPQGTADQLTPENLGRIHLGRVALGYYEGPKSKGGRVIVHLSGVARDGHKRIVEFIRGNAGDKLQVEELDRRLGANGPVGISSSERPFALKIVDDNDAYLAVSLNRDAGASQAREIVEKLPSSTWISAGYNPPWVREAIPSGGHTDVCGFVLGEIPAAWRRLLSETLNLRVCPRTFSGRLKREGGGITLYLTLNVGRAASARLLRDDLEKWRLQGLDRLQARFPELRNEPQALAQVRQTLSRMRWRADGDSVRTQVQLSAPIWASLLTLVKRLNLMKSGKGVIPLPGVPGMPPRPGPRG